MPFFRWHSHAKGKDFLLTSFTSPSASWHLAGVYKLEPGYKTHREGQSARRQMLPVMPPDIHTNMTQPLQCSRVIVEMLFLNRLF